MQVHNVNLPITVTGRHIDVTPAMREYAQKKIEGLHLDYPRIIDAKVILDVQNHRQQKAEIILHCANHIVIEVDSISEDIYASIDESVSKLARRMRKYKTRMLKNHRPRKGSIKHIEEHIYHETALEATDEHIEATYVHKEQYKIRPLFVDEAMMDLAMSGRSFIVFLNQKTHKMAILYCRDDGEYGLIEPDGVPMNGAA